MQVLTRDNLKFIFKKVKHLHLPPVVEEVHFDPLYYFSWASESDQSMYLVYEYGGAQSMKSDDLIKDFYFRIVDDV
jgi:hypothetical protein